MRIYFGTHEVELTGEIYDGTCIRQEFVAQTRRLISVEVYLATYKRQNPGTIVVEIVEGRTVLAQAKVDAALLEDNSYREFGLGVTLTVGNKYELKVYTQQCRGGMSPTAAYGVRPDSSGPRAGYLFVGARLIKQKELRCSFNYEGEPPKEMTIMGPNLQAPVERPPVPEDAIEGLISIVIPHYNCQDWLAKCLASISRQTYSCVEVIVVDDASKEPDKTKEVIDGFRLILPALKYIPLAKNGGAPAARNAGAEYARGEYLYFCDADIELYSEALEILIKCLLEDTGADFAYGGFLWGAQRVVPTAFNEERLREHNFVTTMSLLRRAKFPGWDTQLQRHQDWDLWLTVVDNGGRGVCCHRYLFETPVREGGISSNDNVDMMASRHIVTLKHQLEKK